ncbi:MAG TPA: 30S ribosomal protein S6 [Gammaproteobacteria bacterium]
MRHYEVVFLVHPDQSEQVPAMLDRYRRMIESAEGTIHREEDWGRRQLAHAINKVNKAHYLMFNLECSKDALDELVGAFRFNDAVLRYLVIKRDKVITEPSFMAKAREEEKAKEAQAAAAEEARAKAAEEARVANAEEARAKAAEEARAAAEEAAAEKPEEDETAAEPEAESALAPEEQDPVEVGDGDAVEPAADAAAAPDNKEES